MVGKVHGIKVKAASDQDFYLEPLLDRVRLNEFGLKPNKDIESQIFPILSMENPFVVQCLSVEIEKDEEKGR
ncbi:hypothetical protein CEXT_221581 [Caerostris extrusa]|uniref:Uncharacterized protein n=1 Tax=Caerostris extrusa TaxID=172846 RepID=A0AAV4PIC3_CAEEX|nr:hypothetical protein CEXT_221581 [Caerostris extrusa]